MIARDEAALIEPIERTPILARTLDWAAINSGTANLPGVAAMAGRLAEAFAALLGEVSLVDPAPVEKVGADGRVRAVETGRHLVLRVRPDAERRVLLTGHMDTVYPADHPFQTTDWLDADTLHGPGTADMKGGLSLMLEGLLAYERGAPTLGYDVMINSDEETGSLSSSALIAGLAQGKLAALTYEPALPGGMMARARPGSGNFAAAVTGRSAHAGRNPQDGRNALVAAADLAQRLHRARRDGLSVNPARIEGGAPNNSVPDLAVLHFNIRPRGPEDLAEAQALIAAAIDAVAAEHEVAIHLHGGFARPPKPVSPATESLFALVSRAAADLGEPMAWKDTGGVCDGNNIAACGVPVIDTMGACGGAIHSPEEFLLASSLDARARLTALVLHRLDRHGVAV
ncbi:glutamate carboxypeptidase [Novosphingobium chloroacetimidivorans]|uniref:Glutamate carboxypeptidase n=1 Tax=Novosphingobium chloroacetimidivorans TaxID=1428314 RepID=A0A7W7KB42_9SPHN|nr:hydrolase [Novosphingobium chloroacetimidivorans]MBB4859559.1 glutamate carboxypeptidase [Novosphingobium chloroacetimidivorans]